VRWRDAKKGVHHKGTSKHALPTMAYSPLFSRLKAIIIDSFMIVMPLLYLVFYAIFGSREAFGEHMLTGWLLIIVPHFCITTIFLYFKVQTPGMKAYNLKLIDSTTQEKPTLLKLCFRYFLFIVTSISLFGLLAPLFRKDKQTFYDILSHTALIEIH
jgi:uncharacterized RDD family membrane protein YckC